MSIEIKHLTAVPIAELTETFNAAFAGYFVPVEYIPETKLARMKRGRVRLEDSAGVFFKGQLVAFILSGIDQWEGRLTAYNAGTGVLPAYRRQRLVQQLYDFLLPHYRSLGIEQCTLEVIQANKYAIRAYQNVGLEIVRDLHCLQATISPTPLAADFNWIERSAPDWEAYESIRAFDFSWDQNRMGTEIALSAHRFFELRSNNTLLAYCIFKDANKSIIQAGVKDHNWKVWGEALFAALSQETDLARWINIDSRAEALLHFLEKQGFQPIFHQHEMKMIL